MTQYHIKGKNPVSLTQSDFKAQGGEGRVFIKGSTAYKIYTNSAKMIPVAKINELAALSEPYIIRPQDIILDNQNAPVGYTMAMVPDSYVLCELFTKAFRDRTHLTHDKVLKLVQQMQVGVSHCHQSGVLLVDLNEMNFLVDKAFGQVYFIDVDSYQTKTFHATALMESVRDRHCNGHFTPETDWFSFGVVSFMMFVGIHPFKGKHPNYKKFDERMLRNISVLSKDVAVPSTVYPWDTIPSAYRQWYESIFDGGNRVAPPKDAQAVIIIVTPRATHLTGSNNYNIQELFEMEGDIVSYYQPYTLTTTGIYQAGRKTLNSDGSVLLAITPKLSHTVVVKTENDTLSLFDLNTRKSIPFTLMAEQVMMTDGRIYFKQGGNILEIEWAEGGSELIAIPRITSSVTENATQLFDGLAYQSLLGAAYATLYPHSGASYEVRLKELDGYQVMDARYSGGVLILVAAKDGKYDKFIFRFGKTFTDYDLRKSEDIGTYAINFTILESGVCLHMNENEELELFSANKGSQSLKILKDPAIGGDCKLFQAGAQAVFSRGNKIYKFSMKP